MFLQMFTFSDPFQLIDLENISDKCNFKNAKPYFTI